MFRAKFMSNTVHDRILAKPHVTLYALIKCTFRASRGSDPSDNRSDYDRSPNDGVSHACRNNKRDVNHVSVRGAPPR